MFKNPFSPFFVHIATVIINLFVLASGASFAWSSPALSHLTQPDNPTLHRSLTLTEESLLASLYLVGAILTPPLTGFCSDRYGRKRTLIIFTLPLAAGSLCKAFARSIWVLYLGRVLCGTSAATAFTVIPIYVGEIAEDVNRGMLGTYVGLLTVIGYLYSYGVGPYVSITWLSLGITLFCVIFTVLIQLFVPESPYFLLAKGREVEASAALARFRSTNNLETMKKALAVLQTKGSVADLFKSPTLVRILCVMLVLMIFQQFSGNFAVLAYLQLIFERSGTGEVITPEQSSIIIGVVKILACLVTPAIVDRLGRKLLLVASAAGVAITLLLLGLFFYLSDNSYDVSALQWLPVTSLILFVTSFNIGLATVPLLLIGELFPPKFKSLAGAVIIIWSSALSFLTAFSFPHMNETLGMGPSFWVFAGFSVVGAVFCLFFVPETKGKSFVEIQVMLERNISKKREKSEEKLEKSDEVGVTKDAATVC